jgi:hypothetical protein
MLRVFNCLAPTLLFLSLAQAPHALGQTVPVPSTPAGVALTAWLKALDSLDSNAVEAYVKQYEPTGNVNGMLEFGRSVGGFTLVSIEKSEPDVIRFRVVDGNGMQGAGSLYVSQDEPHVVKQVGVQLVPKGARLDWSPVDAKKREKVISEAGKLLADFYVNPTVAREMEDAVRAKAKSGAYDSATDGSVFAQRLSEDLRAVSHDGHLNLDYSPVVDDGQATPSPGDDADARAHMLKENCGFERVEVLSHNVGYLKLNYFGDPFVCGTVAATAMGFISHTDALVIDLRENAGGDPNMVQVVASWLFDKPTHINDLVNQQEKTTTQYWTLPYVPGDRLAKQPVYVLTSHGTFSGGEEFAYDLQTQKRASIIGETTGGGAHPVSDHRIDEHFSIGVPYAHPVNPVTGKDWEGTGVVPDVQAPAKEALSRALQLAEDRLTKAIKMDGVAPKPVGDAPN